MLQKKKFGASLNLSTVLPPTWLVATDEVIRRAAQGQPISLKMRILGKGAVFCSKKSSTRIRKEGLSK
jgi:hypothetical protein